MSLCVIKEESGLQAKTMIFTFIVVHRVEHSSIGHKLMVNSNKLVADGINKSGE